MVRPPRKPRSSCPINFGLEIFGDRWTLLVLRDLLMQGKRRFGEFQTSDEGIASNILSERLLRLEQSGLIRRHTVEGDARQVHYLPTDACRKLLPVLVEMAYWGATHDPKTAAPKSFATAYETDRAALLTALAKGIIPDQ
jgi:DNA-binding HxlR family transcriptional regulator